MTTENIPYDRLGNEIKVEDYVAFATRGSLKLGLVIKINPKTIKVLHIDPAKPRNHHYIWPPLGSKSNKYPEECVVVNGPKVTMYLLKKE